MTAGRPSKPVEQKRLIGNPGKRALPSNAMALPRAIEDPIPGRPLLRYGQELWDKIARAILQAVDLRPRAIIENLSLRNPIFSDTTCYGHFGKEQMTWEKLDLADSIERAL